MLRYATLFSTKANQKQLLSGLCMLVTASIGIFSNAPAEAKLLNGGVEVVDIDTTPSDTTVGTIPQSANTPSALTTGGAPLYRDNNVAPAARAPQQQISTPAISLQPGQPVLAYGRAPNAAPTTPPPNSFPVNYAGHWQCVTRVVDSSVSSIGIGTQLVSEVVFAEVGDGRVIARWVQPGWTETQASAMSWSAKEAQTDRTSYYFGEGMNGSWASRSRDHFMQVGQDRLECKSYVDQYMDGQYLGRYRTISVLTRLSTDVNTIAQGERREK